MNWLSASRRARSCSTSASPTNTRPVTSPGAVLVPLGDVPERVAELPAGEPVLIICRSGARSMAAAEFLVSQHGIDAVNVAGGTLAWIQTGRDVVVSTEPT